MKPNWKYVSSWSGDADSFRFFLETADQQAILSKTWRFSSLENIDNIERPDRGNRSAVKPEATVGEENQAAEL